MKKIIILLTIVLMVPIFGGCVPRTPPEALSPLIPSPEEMLKRIGASDVSHDILTATGRITITASEGTYSKRVAVAARRPSSLRIETLPIFGTPDLVLSVNNTLLKAYLPHEQNFYIGRASMENVLAFTRLPLDTHEIVSLLMGSTPLARRDALVLKGALEEDLYRIDMLAGGKRVQSLLIEPKRNRILQTEGFTPRGEISYTVRFEDFITVEGSCYPQQLRITIHRPEKIHASVKYSNIQVSRQTDGTLFDLTIPQGAKLIFMK